MEEMKEHEKKELEEAAKYVLPESLQDFACCSYDNAITLL